MKAKSEQWLGSGVTSPTQGFFSFETHVAVDVQETQRHTNGYTPLLYLIVWEALSAVLDVTRHVLFC